MTARRGRAVAAAQLALGAALTVRPQPLLDAAGGAACPTWIARILGARSLAQAVVTLAAPTSDVLRLGALVDATHAVSLLPVVAVSPRFRRVATTSAAVATVSGLAGWAASGGHG